MATRTVTVKPTGGNYATLAAAVAGEIVANANLTVNNGSGSAGILIIEISGDWSGGADTTVMTIQGFTTSATEYLVIRTDAANRALKSSWDTSRYIIHNNNSASYLFTIQDQYIRFEGLQVQVTVGPNNTYSGFYLSGVLAGGSDIRIDSCRVVGVCSGTGGGYGIYNNDADAVLNVFNCIVEGFISGADKGFANINAGTSCVTNVYNCTIRNGYRGLLGAAITASNCAIFDCTDDISSSTIDYCALDDADAQTHPVAESGGGAGWPSDFVAAATGNFTLLVGSGLVGTGVDDPGSGIYNYDIDGVARSSPWDVGADEYVAAAGGLSISATVSDGLLLEDGSSVNADFMAAVADALNAGDAAGVVFDFAAAVADGLVLADSALYGGAIFDEVAADGVAFSDAGSATAGFLVTVADGVSLAEAVSAIAQVVAEAADGLIAADTAGAWLDAFVTVADGILAADSAAGSAVIAALAVDGFTVSDTGAVTVSFQATAADGVSVADAASALAVLLAQVADGVVVSDTGTESSVYATGLVTTTITALQATVTVTAKRATISVTVKAPSVTFTAKRATISVTVKAPSVTFTG